MSKYSFEIYEEYTNKDRLGNQSPYQIKKSKGVGGGEGEGRRGV